MNSTSFSCIPTGGFNMGCNGDKRVTSIPFALENGNHLRIPLERTNELAPEERIEGLNDLHGVSTTADETPEKIHVALEELEMGLSRLSDPKDAYERAKLMDMQYVQGLRIRFLRAAAFDVVEAAKRFAYHFECRQKYFGTQKLVGNLTFADLKPEEVPYFNTGLAQLLPEKDRSGRAIIVTNGRQYSTTPVDTIIRLQFIFGDIATQDEEVQKKGFVYIYFTIGQTQYTPARTMGLIKTMKGSPMRLAAAHLCYDNPILHPLVNMAILTLPSHLLIRYKCHFGSVLECLYNLRTFGIPTEALPVNLEGVWRMLHDESILDGSRSSTPHSDSVSNRSQSPMDSCSSYNNKDSCEPLPMDVLLGRGKGGIKSLGNQRLKMLQEEYRDRYENGNRLQKIYIAQVIFDAMMDSGSRFVMHTEDRQGWTVVSDTVAKKSIAHGFRNMRRVAKIKQFVPAKSQVQAWWG